MPYTALPDRRIPYDNDGTVVGQASNGLTNGIQSYPTQSDLAELQDGDLVMAGQTYNNNETGVVWCFFPEQREVTAYFAVMLNATTGAQSTAHTWYGSNDSTNGLDGTWETASLPGGSASYADAYSWRSAIKAISFTGGKRTVRFVAADAPGNDAQRMATFHLYGEKVAGQTPDDLIYIDHDTTPGVEYTAPEDFGDQPLATTVVRQFRLKNTSGTKTANSINVQCNDSDFAISTDGTTWVVTINIASLGPGAQSATMYVRCTTPAPGNLLGPRFARIVTTVASYT